MWVAESMRVSQPGRSSESQGAVIVAPQGSQQGDSMGVLRLMWLPSSQRTQTEKLIFLSEIVRTC